MKLNKQQLIAALDKAILATDSNNNYFFFKKDAVHATTGNLGITVPCALPEELVGAVKADDFYGLIKRFVIDEIDITIKGDSIEVKGGKAKAKIKLYNTEPKVEWPSTPSDEFVKLPSNFKMALDTCFIPGNGAVVSGMFVNEDELIFTDRIKITRHILDDHMPTMWISDAVAKVMMRLDITHYYTQKGVIAFNTLDGIVLKAKPLYSEQYPVTVVDTYIKMAEETEPEFEFPAELSDVIKRASPLALKEDRATFMMLTGTSDGIVVSTSKFGGEYEELVSCDCPEFDPIAVDIRHLQYGLQRAKKASILKKEHQGRPVVTLILHGIDCVCVIITAKV